MMARHPLVLAKHRIVDALSDQHGSVRVRCRIGADGIAQGVEPGHACELQMREFGCPGEKMHMRLDEAWQHRAARGIDDFRADAFPFGDLRGAACRGDQPVLDRNRLGRRSTVIHSDNAGVGDDQVGDLQIHDYQGAG